MKKLTKEIIEEAIHAYAENADGYWLKVYHFAGDQLKAKKIKQKKESAEFDKLDQRS